MRKGFTLLELVVVIIVVGILATLGLAQYTRTIEKGRTAEARNNLGMLRSSQLAYYQELGVYSNLGNLNTGLPSSADTGYYFTYSCDTSNGTCTATRNSSGGKSPAHTLSAYTVTLTVAGAFGGTTGYF